MLKPTNARAEVLISDPWESVSQLAANSFTARVFTDATNGERDAFILRADVNFYVDDTRCEWFVAKLRHVNTRSPGNDGYNIIRIPSEQANGANPLDTGTWRGGVALLGTVSVIDDTSS